MLTLKDLTRSFSGRVILDHINLSFAPKQTHVLIGASGSGKTTLLRLILGLDRPSAGAIELDGARLDGDSQTAWARKIGYVPQNAGLFPHLTAADNVTLVARTLGWSKTEAGARLEELRQTTGLEPELLRRFPKQLSGGQQQRIAIMRAAFLDPKIMILDEPLGALDPILRSDLQEQLKEIFNRLGKTVLMVTHDLGEAAFFGHTITLLNEARVEQTGTIEDFMERPASPYVARFIGAQRTLGDWRSEA